MAAFTVPLSTSPAAPLSPRPPVPINHTSSVPRLASIPCPTAVRLPLLLRRSSLQSHTCSGLSPCSIHHHSSAREPSCTSGRRCK
ncbi:hypothetical protein M0R45_030331 [Rubus argutus]|uniref:Uncharacterized protein n=1 Tax=Rubus argutus TaxID=59490 RepID=A0AAW1WCU7_RUBAR